MRSEIKVTAQQLKRKKKLYRIAKFLLIAIVLLLILIYAAVSFIYNGYFFTISLDKNLYLENDVIIYDDPDYKVYRSKLYVESLDFFDDIAGKWLPNDLDSVNGSHNGENYIAYTFYIENMGEDVVDYYSELIIDDVIKNVDEAIRFKVYFNGEETVYAKESSLTGEAEEGTEKFYNEDSVMLRHVEDFGPGDIHKYTVVMWLEGTDLDCTNNLIGGELKAHMDFKSVHLESGE